VTCLRYTGTHCAQFAKCAAQFA